MKAGDKQAIQDIIDRTKVVAGENAETLKGKERAARAAELLDQVESALLAPAGWMLIDLRRRDVFVGGLIVIQSEHAFNRVVALINDHCPAAEETKQP